MADIDSTNKKYHHGNLRLELLTEARQLLEQQGVEAVGLREVARLSGVSPNAPYRHFADKEALLAAVAEQGFEELLLLLKQAETAPTVAERYTAGCRAYIGFATHHHAMIQLMFDTFSGKYGRYPFLQKAAREALQQFIRMVSTRYDIANEDAAFTHAIAVWSLLHGFATLQNAGALDFERRDLLPTPEQLANMIAPPSEAH